MFLPEETRGKSKPINNCILIRARFAELRTRIFIGGMVIKPAPLAMGKQSSQAIKEFNEIGDELSNKRIFLKKNFPLNFRLILALSHE